MRSVLLHLGFIALLAGSLIGVGCGASKGEPCKERDDCESGLRCCPAAGGSTGRGFCEDMCTSTGRDAGTDSGAGDASGSDAAVDGSAGDAASDAAGSDASETDGAVDGSATDSGVDATSG